MNEPAAYMTKDGHIYKKHQTRPIEADISLYALRELTDEEIESEWFNIFKPEPGIGKNITNGIYDFARSILKKAREK